jgi:hypothetical protein
MPTLKTALSVQYIEENFNRVHRFMDTFVSHEPDEYRTGMISLEGSEADHVISGVKHLVLRCNDNFTIKASDSTQYEMTQMRFFAYDGSRCDFFISNPSSDPIQIEIVSADY